MIISWNKELDMITEKKSTIEVKKLNQSERA